MAESARRKKITFISTMTSVPWGGSEFLWHDTALRLVAAGHEVTASVHGWPEAMRGLATLKKAGVIVRERWRVPDKITGVVVPKLVRSALRPFINRAFAALFVRRLIREKPDLVCVSQGGITEEPVLLNHFLGSGLPYGVVLHVVDEQTWPNDLESPRLRQFYCQARRMFFVSAGNRTLLETQLGMEFTNSELVRNPYNLRRDAAPPWPANMDPIRLACVGRLNPQAKGQDLLIQLLATEPWRSRAVTVSLYGVGQGEHTLRRLVKRYGLCDKIRFCGHTGDVEGVWATHHALLLPSRHEGMPVVIVEAMLCGRPVIVTDVAGNTEIVQDGTTGFVAAAPTVRHLNAAMERAWEQRHRWEKMGQAAAVNIRKLLPADPAEDFARRLIELADDSQLVMPAQAAAT